MTIEPVYLLEIQCHDGTAVRTLRYSSGGFVTRPNDNPSDTTYAAAIIDPGTFARSLFSDNRTSGRSEVDYGEIVLININGALDDLLNYGFDGRTVRLLRLSSQSNMLATAEVVFMGTIDKINTGNAYNEFRLVLYDRRRDLDRPLLTTKYLGTTVAGGLPSIADGGPELKDKVVPRVFGKVFNISPPLVNQYDVIYQVSGAVVTLIQAYDGAIPLTNAGDFATPALLRSASIRPGKFGTCLASGLLRLGCKPAFALTCDVTEGPTAEWQKASSITQRMLALMGITGGANVNAASFTALGLIAGHELGDWVDDDRTGITAIGNILSSVGAYLLPNVTNAFEVGRLSAPAVTPLWTLVEEQLLEGVELLISPDSDNGIPPWRVNLDYARSHTVQRGEEVCYGASISRTAFVGVEARSVKAEDTSILTKYRLSSEIYRPTCITTISQAQAEADRLLVLYGVRRDLLRVMIPRRHSAGINLGTTGKLTLSRLGYTSGRNMVVIGRLHDPANERVGLTLWG